MPWGASRQLGVHELLALSFRHCCFFVVSVLLCCGAAVRSVVGGNESQTAFPWTVLLDRCRRSGPGQKPHPKASLIHRCRPVAGISRVPWWRRKVSQVPFGPV